MMRLSTMLRLIRTIDPEGCSPVVDQLLANWEHDTLSLRFLRVSSNFIFSFTADGQRRFLRFNHASERSLEAIQAELDFVRHVAAGGCRVAQPLLSNKGRFVEPVETELGTYLAVVFEEIGGDWYETEDLPDELLPAWGRALAQLHNAAQGYARPGRPGWRAQLEAIQGRLAPQETAAAAALRKVRLGLEQLPATPANSGLIHFDFEPDNLAWQDGSPTSIDFDDCAYHWFAADVAFALRDLFDDRADRVDLEDPRLLRFLEGYRSLRPLDPAEFMALPLFLAYNHLVHFGDLLRVLEDAPQAGDPAWSLELRQKLEGKLEKYRQVFAAWAQK